MTDLARTCTRWSDCVGPRDHQGSCLDETGLPMPMPDARRADTRLLTAVCYRPERRTLSVVYDDGEIVEVVTTLKLPAGAGEICGVAHLDEFRRGVELRLADGTMHDVAADYLTWLTNEAYRQQYPDECPDEDIGARIGANVVTLRNRRAMSQAALAHRTGILGPNLSRLESGKHVPTLNMLLRRRKRSASRWASWLDPTRRSLHPAIVASPKAVPKAPPCDCDLRDRMWNGYGKCLRCGHAYKDPREGHVGARVPEVPK